LACSWYRYRQRADVDGHPHSTKTIAFDDFVNEYAKGETAGWANVGSPTKLLRRGSGKVIVDHLFQNEQMDKLVSFLEERLDFKITLKQRNVSHDRDLTLSEKTESKLLRKKTGDVFRLERCETLALASNTIGITRHGCVRILDRDQLK
jgi:hypothetical protein